MRERGSSTARPTEKGGGGSPDSVAIRSISSRFADFLLAFRADSVGFVASFRADSVGFVAIRRLPLGVSCRHQRQDTKKARFLNRGIGLSYRKVSRALNLQLIPLANTRASVRGVLRGLARRSCIVMLTSDRRHIVHYT